MRKRGDVRSGRARKGRNFQLTLKNCEKGLHDHNNHDQPSYMTAQLMNRVPGGYIFPPGPRIICPSSFFPPSSGFPSPPSSAGGTAGRGGDGGTTSPSSAPSFPSTARGGIGGCVPPNPPNAPPTPKPPPPPSPPPPPFLFRRSLNCPCTLTKLSPSRFASVNALPSVRRVPTVSSIWSCVPSVKVEGSLARAVRPGV